MARHLWNVVACYYPTLQAHGRCHKYDSNDEGFLSGIHDPGLFSVALRIGMFCLRQSFCNSPLPTLSPGRFGAVDPDQTARHATALSHVKSSTHEHKPGDPHQRPGTMRSGTSSGATPARRASRYQHREVSHGAGSSAKAANRPSPQGFPPVSPNFQSRLDFRLSAAHLRRIH
jgi:hypothetical protein